MIKPPFQMIRVGALDLLRLEPAGPGCQFWVTTRRGGQSFGRGDLNLSYGTGDDPENVKENRRLLHSAIGVSEHGVAALRQRHTADVIVADEGNWQALVRCELEADGLVTGLRNRWLRVSIGDCLAAALFDPRRAVLALVHAGWAGTAKKIVAAAVDKMTGSFGCRPTDIRAALAPNIGPAGYEVDGPVFELFNRHWTDWQRFVYDSRGTKGHLDLAAANRSLLEERRVPKGNIFDSGLCTRSLPALFFSHRRDGLPSGRMMAFAVMR